MLFKSQTLERREWGLGTRLIIYRTKHILQSRPIVIRKCGLLVNFGLSVNLILLLEETLPIISNIITEKFSFGNREAGLYRIYMSRVSIEQQYFFLALRQICSALCSTGAVQQVITNGTTPALVTTHTVRNRTVFLALLSPFEEHKFFIYIYLYLYITVSKHILTDFTAL